VTERDVGIDVQGLKELDEAFTALGLLGSKTTLRAALRKAAKPIAVEANLLAPTGDTDTLPQKRLKGSFVVRTTLNKSQRRQVERTGIARVYVGSTSPVAHLVEFGHLVKSRGPHRKGSTPTSGASFVQPHPILRPAFDLQKQAVMGEFRRILWGEIARTAKRFRRQAERGKLSRAARGATGAFDVSGVSVTTEAPEVSE